MKKSCSLNVATMVANRITGFDVEWKTVSISVSGAM